MILLERITKTTLVLMVAAHCLPAQPSRFKPLASTAVALTFSGTGSASPTASGGFNFTIAGNADVGSFGKAAVTGNGTVNSIAYLTSSTPVTGTLTFAFAQGDTMAGTFSIPAGVVVPAIGSTTSAKGTITILSGTGKYAGATGLFEGVTGSGTATSLTTATFQLQGNGTIDVPTAASVVVKGVVSASAYGGFKDIAPGMWIEIYGAGLSSTTRTWDKPDFTNGGLNAPISLDGVKVTIGGQAAFVAYISPGQVNALVPSNAGTGPTQLTITNGNLTSTPYPINVKPILPGLLAPGAFIFNSRQYVGAVIPNTQTFVGIPSNPVKTGATITIYGNAFGPVTPTTNAGTVAAGLTSLGTKPHFLFGTTPADISYYGLVPGLTGLYQFDIVVPAVTPDPAVPLTFDLGGTAGTQTLYIAVAQ